MGANTALLTAIISAVVSLIVALITVAISQATIKAEREKLEKSLQRNMTTKLYDVRIAVYPKAMKITEGLRKSFIKDNEIKLTKAYFQTVLKDLDAWHATEAAFIISRKTLDQLYILRDALRQEPEENDTYSPFQIDVIWKAKNEFRAALRDDIQLLFKEDKR